MLNPAPEPEPCTLPRHIAIIMDGNGRWAKARGLPRIAGHREGANAVRRAVEACREREIPFLTLYAFSSENWKRPVAEVDDLMGLLRHYLKREIRELAENGIRLNVIGDRTRLAPDIQRLITDAEEKTRYNDAMVLTIAVSYGSQAEILNAVKAVAEAVAGGQLAVDDIDDAVFEGFLETRGLPEPDLLIRTSGEQRLSNFLLWQAAYTELLFMDVLWPDFDDHALSAAIDAFNARERRYGETAA